MNSYDIATDEDSWVSFHERLYNSSEGTSEKLQTLDTMVQDIVTDYETHHNVFRAHEFLSKLEVSMREFFNSLGEADLSEQESQILADLCKKLNEDSMLQLIRDSNINERLHGDDGIKMPTRELKSMASISDSPITSFRRRANHQRQMSSFMEPKIIDYHVAKVFSQDLDNIQEIPLTENDEHENELDKVIKSTRLLRRISSIPKTSDNSKVDDEINEERKSIEILFEKMKEENDEHRIEDAFKILKEIEDLIQDVQFSNKHKDFILSKLEENKTLIEDIKSDYKFLSKVITELEDENGYELEKAKKNSVIKYKSLPGGGVSIKLESTVDLPLFNLITLFYEPEGYAKWTPFCKDSKLVTRLGRASEIMWLRWDLPPPVFGREGHLLGVGFDRLSKNGSIVLLSKTIDSQFLERYGINYPKPKYTRMEIPYVGVELSPLSENKTRMRLVSTFDPKIAFIPLSLTSWVARKGASFMLDTMVKHASNLKGGMWEQSMERSKEFYDWLRVLIDNYLAKKKQEKQ